jgi:transposase
MGKKAHLDIQESIPELQKILVKRKSMQEEKRIKCLIAIKSAKFGTRQELAGYLGIHIRTMERWVNSYKSGGIFEMLSNKPKNKQSRIITQEIHQGLELRVNDPQNPFRGYWDAQNWVKCEYGIEIKYQRIREYLIQHFNTKTKSPRKSHIKKDKQAEESFLKTPKHIQYT